MIQRRYKATLDGKNPLLMHRDNLAFGESVQQWFTDPENAKNSKKGDDRTPAWTWLGCIYETYDKERFSLDPDCLMTCIREGGAKVPTGRTRGDKTYKRATQSNILIDGELDFTVGGRHIPVAPFRDLMHSQGSGLDFGAQLKLAEEHGFELLVKRAKIGMSKHVRVRPLFRNWRVICTLTVLDEEGSGLTKDVLAKVFQQAGTYCGLGDWRPSSPKSPGTFGTFTATLEVIG
jgi:hypothetical protein